MAWNIADLEALGANIVQGIVAHETEINVVAGLAGILPEVSAAERFLPALVGTFQFMQQETGRTLPQVVGDLISHITPGQPLSPVLAGPVAIGLPADKPGV